MRVPKCSQCFHAEYSEYTNDLFCCTIDNSSSYLGGQVLAVDERRIGNCGPHGLLFQQKETNYLKWFFLTLIVLAIAGALFLGAMLTTPK